MRPIPNVPRRPAARAVLTVLAVCAGLAAAATASAQVRGPETLGFKKRFFVEITNPSPLALENHAVVLDVAAIRASVAPDFNTYYYAFFEEQGSELALVVSQADDFDKDRYPRRDRRRPDAPGVLDDAPGLLVHSRAQLPAHADEQGLRPRRLAVRRRRSRPGNRTWPPTSSSTAGSASTASSSPASSSASSRPPRPSPRTGAWTSSGPATRPASAA